MSAPHLKLNRAVSDCLWNFLTNMWRPKEGVSPQALCPKIRLQLRVQQCPAWPGHGGEPANLIPKSLDAIALSGWLVLQMKLSVDCSYLAGEGPDGLGPALRQITVFHCGDALRGRAVYGIHLPITGRCVLQTFASVGLLRFVVDRGRPFGAEGHYWEHGRHYNSCATCHQQCSEVYLILGYV